MSEGGGIPAAVFRNGLIAGAANVRTARVELCALDASAGDGDLGTTLDAGFTEAISLLDDAGRDGDIGAMLCQIGRELARKAPSTIGTLLAGAFLRAGNKLAGVTELAASDAVGFFSATAAGVAERGGAEVGQRTILDAMVSASEAAAAAARNAVGAPAVLRAAAAGARSGAEATAGMKPVHGRAGWIKERAQGTRDAGAVAWALYVDGLANACTVARPERHTA